MKVTKITSANMIIAKLQWGEAVREPLLIIQKSYNLKV